MPRKKDTSLAKTLTDEQKDVLAGKISRGDNTKAVAQTQMTATRANRKLHPEMIEVILTEVAHGRSVKSVCDEIGIATGVLYRRASDDLDLRQRLDTARATGTRTLVDSLLEIPMDESISDGRAKLLSDNIKWIVARHNRDEYGEKPLFTAEKLIVQFNQDERY